MSTKCITCGHEIFQIDGHNHIDTCAYNIVNDNKLESKQIRFTINKYTKELLDNKSLHVSTYRWSMINNGYLNVLYAPKYIDHAIKSYVDNNFDMEFTEFIDKMYGQGE